MASRFDAIVREMSNTLLRSARSAVINMGRDFSCSIVTADNRLLASAEGLPVHVFGSHLQTKSMCDLHSDLAAGDAFLHNDVYLGNTHAGDQTVIVPVFVEGVHLFSVCAKAHQADIGNSQPTTYMAGARDIYEEGALIFPCIRIQRSYEDVHDIIRMCRRRIRVPEQWYGDYLAALGAARIAERRLKEYVDVYGREAIEEFIDQWFDYSERCMADAIRKMPAGRLVERTQHDPILGFTDGIPIKVVIEIEPNSGTIEIDLTDNPDCVPAGLNLSQACATNNSMQGVFSVIGPSVPTNAGSFRRLSVRLRENCVVGIPSFPHSCSVATTNLGDRLVNVTQRAFAQFGEPWGLAEGGMAMGPANAVLSGADWRREQGPFVNQLILATNGGPASASCDGWLTWGLPVGAGMTYRDSVEVDELKHPIHIQSLELLVDSAGAGKFRGGAAGRIVYGPKREPITVIFSTDGHATPPAGVVGGQNGTRTSAAKIDVHGKEIPLSNTFAGVLKPGEWIVGVDSAGGGYGRPIDRDPHLVLHDVRERWVSPECAKHVYGVVLIQDDQPDSLTVDESATHQLRESIHRVRQSQHQVRLTRQSLL